LSHKVRLVLTDLGIRAGGFDGHGTLVGVKQAGAHHWKWTTP
jgi:hypothetical protein